MRVLATGGAGYIGSITVETLLARGTEAAVLDNLSTGWRGALFPEASFYEADLLDVDTVTAALKEFQPDAIVHFAAKSLVGESVSDPAKYMNNNVVGTIQLLDAMRAAGVKNIVFSSTAATYGEPDRIPITEDLPTKPTNPYGLTKRFMEQVFETYAPAYGMRYTCLRYFNAAGASKRRGECHDPETHLIPLVLDAAEKRRPNIKVFGTDYDTPDGTCVRDYIHVEDLADAHLRAIDRLVDGGESLICNLGNGSGYSVREVIDVCREVTGLDIAVEETGRRPGDPARLVASAGRAAGELGWKPAKPDLASIVTDAWNWRQSNPDGYKG